MPGGKGPKPDFTIPLKLRRRAAESAFASLCLFAARKDAGQPGRYLIFRGSYSGFGSESWVMGLSVFLD